MGITVLDTQGLASHTIGEKRSQIVSTRNSDDVQLPVTAGLTLWVRADQITGSDGDAVGTWADQSGNGYDLTQATAANKPTLKTNIQNGKAVVRFDGTNDRMDGTAINNLIAAASFSAYVVVNVKSFNTNNIDGYSNEAIWSESVGGNITAYGRSSGPTLGIENYGGGERATKTVVANTWYVIHYRHEGGNLYISINDGAETSLASGNSLSTNPIRFGANYAASVAGDHIEMDLAEVVFYNTAITSQNKTDLQTYLNDRWAVY